MLPHVALGKNRLGVSAGQSLEQKCDTEERVIRGHVLVVREEEHVLRAGQGATWHCGEAVGAGWGVDVALFLHAILAEGDGAQVTLC